MKHTFKIIIFFLLLFAVSNITGLYLVNKSISKVQNIDGLTQINYTSTAIGERADIHGTETLIYILISVLIGTILLLVLAKKKKKNWWKTWFLISVTLAISVALGVFVKKEYYLLVWLISAGIAYFKIYHGNVYIQNISEILMYAGIAVLFVPLLDVATMLTILGIISIYDMYAVWKSKHMILLAKFTMSSNIFPGLMLPYKRTNKKISILKDFSFNKQNKQSKEVKQDKQVAKKKIKSVVKTGILGGGDVVFPLFFAGTVMIKLIKEGYSLSNSFIYSLIIVLGSTIALFLLFYYGKKERFYPAMPFLSIGCVVSYLILLLIV